MLVKGSRCLALGGGTNGVALIPVDVEPMLILVIEPRDFGLLRTGAIK